MRSLWSIHPWLRLAALGRRSLSLKMIRAVVRGLRIPADVLLGEMQRACCFGMERESRSARRAARMACRLAFTGNIRIGVLTRDEIALTIYRA